MSNPKPLLFAALFLVATFLSALILPLSMTDVRGVEKISLTENRALNTFPGWAWNRDALDRFPAAFEAAFNDHFGLRSFLVHAHSLFKLACIGVSPVEDVVLGKQGWLYYQNTVQEYRGATNIAKTEADRWVAELKAKQAWLAARHIRYLLVVAPNKEEVYPEFLPDNICRLREHYFLDDIISRLGSDSGVEILDLRETLRRGKTLGKGPVYDRTDTHWSQLGAFLAANSILQRIQPWFPQLQPVPLSACTFSRQTGLGGDLAGMMGLNSELPEERVVVSHSAAACFASAPLRLQTECPPGTLTSTPMAFESSNPERNLRLLVTGDSFGNGLMACLPEHFRRVVQLRLQIPYTAPVQTVIRQVVETEKPDIYLDIFAARHIRRPPKASIEKP